MIQLVLSKMSGSGPALCDLLVSLPLLVHGVAILLEEESWDRCIQLEASEAEESSERHAARCQLEAKLTTLCNRQRLPTSMHDRAAPAQGAKMDRKSWHQPCQVRSSMCLCQLVLATS